MTTELRSLDLIPCINEQLLKVFSERARPWIEKACDYDAEFDVAEIGQGIADKKFQLWVIWDNEKKEVKGAGVTRIAINRRGEKRGFDVVFASEDLAKVAPLFDRVEEFFRAEGCIESRLQTRPGLAKTMRKDHGYRDCMIVMKKALV